MAKLWSVIMAGGVGSRFWPASRAARPKQMLDLFGQGSMLRMTYERVLPLASADRQVVVTGSILGDAIRAELPELPADQVLCEPCGRNTAPAIAWAALEIARRDPDAVLMVLPADQFIADVPRYQEVAAHAARAAAEGSIVTLGIPPSRPETGYGYIKRGEARGEGVYAVDAFKEKPDRPTALTYLADGGYYWNAGMFFMPAALILEELRRFEPELMKLLDTVSADNIETLYPQLKKISIDYAVMERTERIAVITGDFGWSDVGSWRSLWDHRPAKQTTFQSGDVIEIDGSGNVLFADGGTVAAIGVHDLVVVHTPDATFVCPREEAQRAREIVDALTKDGKKELL